MTAKCSLYISLEDERVDSFGFDFNQGVAAAAAAARTMARVPTDDRYWCQWTCYRTQQKETAACWLCYGDHVVDDHGDEGVRGLVRWRAALLRRTRHLVWGCRSCSPLMICCFHCPPSLCSGWLIHNELLSSLWHLLVPISAKKKKWFKWSHD